jgi:hypothetical protein
MATTTINTTAGEDARLVVAYGHILGLGRNATQAEIKAYLVATMIRDVRVDEAAVAAAAAQAAAGIAPT